MLKMQNTIFLVEDEPYCLFDGDLARRNEMFLQGLDAGFFDYNTNAHLTGVNDKYASTALRIAQHHAIETLFSLAGVYVQAPDCGYAWLAKCQTPQLRSLVKRICQSDVTLHNKLMLPSISWRSIAERMFVNAMPESAQREGLINGFSMLWEELAGMFLDPASSDEYNAMKHGFRIANGGFQLSMSVNPTTGESDPFGVPMEIVGESEYGATFLKVINVGDMKKTRSLRTVLTTANWSAEQLIHLNKLLHISINNFIAALRLINKWAPDEKCKFLYPEDSESYSVGWAGKPSIMSMTIDEGLGDEGALILTKEQILERLKKIGRM